MEAASGRDFVSKTVRSVSSVSSVVKSSLPLCPPCPLWLKLPVPLKDSLAAAITRLTAAEVPSPRLNAELLLMFTLSCDRAYLFAHPERELTSDEQSRYAAALAERARGVPAQYITGHQEFWGMDLIVTPAVLIPRPETEHLIETILELHKGDVGLQAADFNPKSRPDFCGLLSASPT